MNEPIFFKNGEEWRKWLEKNHKTQHDLELGFWKTKTKKGGITPQEALDEALCYGWIDAVRTSLGDESYKTRYAQRRRNSIWSQINLKRVEELIAEGRMKPAGKAIYEARDVRNVNRYSTEVRVELEGDELKELNKNKAATEFWEKVAPSYRRAASWWVLQAKREETRNKRLAVLIECSANGDRIPSMRPNPKK